MPLWFDRLTKRFPWKFNENIIEQPKHYEWFIISCSGLDIGTIWIEKEKEIKEAARLGILIGNKEYWNKGIGQIAIEKAIENSKDKLNFKEIYLNVRNSNHRAISCYRNCGFFQIGEDQKTDDKGNKSKFIKMKKEINENNGL